MKNIVRLLVTQMVDIKNPNTCHWVHFTPKTYDAIDKTLAKAVEKTGKGKIIDEETAPKERQVRPNAALCAPIGGPAQPEQPGDK